MSLAKSKIPLYVLAFIVSCVLLIGCEGCSRYGVNNRAKQNTNTNSKNYQNQDKSQNEIDETNSRSKQNTKTVYAQTK